ncbi:hypothetical protein [Nonomuraea ceibae]|uniref:hypothetical protein n=1 Tax=Nonomuraea ceibae TaxID=1935170 RepID=UPI001C5F5175|nr:hypothetical protein [Nonomuraea ceibae]
MVTAKHEALHRLFQTEPSLLPRTLQILDIPFPDECEVTVINADLTEIVPVERRCDTLLDVRCPDGPYTMIIESQLEEDAAKGDAWAYYVSYLKAKYGHQVVLIVICQKPGTARWAREPKTIGLPGRPTSVLYPVVLGPDNVPAITDRSEAAKDVVLAAFSAITHGTSRRVNVILDALAAALDTIDSDHAGFLAEFTEVGLGDTKARRLWRELMSTKTYRYQSEYAQQLRAEGEARSVLKVLEQRGVQVPDAVRERVMACTDTDLLDELLVRSLKVSSAEELFG